MMDRREIIEMTDIWNHRVELKMTKGLIEKMVFLQGCGFKIIYIDNGEFYMTYPNGTRCYYATIRSLSRAIVREYRKLKA